MEVALVKWIGEMRSERKKLSRMLILNKAYALGNCTKFNIKIIGINTTTEPYLCGGKPPATDDPEIRNAYLKRLKWWYYRFLMRHNLAARRKITSLGQKLPRNWKQMHLQIMKECKDTIALNKIPPRNVGNADETPFNVENPGTVTAGVPIGEHSVPVQTGGKEKERNSALPTVWGEGGSCRPLLVFKGTRDPVVCSTRCVRYQLDHPHSYELPDTLVYSCNPKSYVYSQELEGPWFTEVAEYLNGAVGMMLLDDYKCHKEAGIRKKLRDRNIFLVIVPGGLTPVAQPLDLWINRLLNDYHKMCYEYWALDQVMNEDGKIPYPSRSLVATWFSCAWRRIKQKDIVRSFVKAGVTRPDDYESHIRLEYDLDRLYPVYHGVELKNSSEDSVHNSYESSRSSNGSAEASDASPLSPP
jgi:hypothetical protein